LAEGVAVLPAQESHVVAPALRGPGTPKAANRGGGSSSTGGVALLATRAAHKRAAQAQAARAKSGEDGPALEPSEGEEEGEEAQQQQPSLAPPPGAKIARYGPDRCISTWRGAASHCIVRTDCNGKLNNLASYAVQLFCIEASGNRVRHVFEQGAFDAQETFDTEIQCHRCVGVKEKKSKVKPPSRFQGALPTVSPGWGELPARVSILNSTVKTADLPSDPAEVNDNVQELTEEVRDLKASLMKAAQVVAALATKVNDPDFQPPGGPAAAPPKLQPHLRATEAIGAGKVVAQEAPPPPPAQAAATAAAEGEEQQQQEADGQDEQQQEEAAVEPASAEAPPPPSDEEEAAAAAPQQQQQQQQAAQLDDSQPQEEATLEAHFEEPSPAGSFVLRNPGWSQQPQQQQWMQRRPDQQPLEQDQLQMLQRRPQPQQQQLQQRQQQSQQDEVQDDEDGGPNAMRG